MLNAKFFWNDKNKSEVDFVIPEYSLACEVKHQEHIYEHDYDNLNKFKQRFDRQFEVKLITKKQENKTTAYYNVEKQFKEEWKKEKK